MPLPVLVAQWQTCFLLSQNAAFNVVGNIKLCGQAVKARFIEDHLYLYADYVIFHGHYSVSAINIYFGMISGSQ